MLMVFGLRLEVGTGKQGKLKTQIARNPKANGKACRCNTRVSPRLVYQPSIENSIPEFHASRSKRDDRELWLPDVKVEPVDLLVSRVKSYVSQEVQELMWDQDSVLHYVQHTDGDVKSEGEYEGGGGITGRLEDMQLYVLEKAPILWELCG